MGGHGEQDSPVYKQGMAWVDEIDFARDRNITLFKQHLMIGLSAFAQSGQSGDEALKKYVSMLRLAEIYLGKAYDFDFVAFRREARRIVDEMIRRGDISKDEEYVTLLQLEIGKVAELLDQERRVVYVTFKLRPGVSEDDLEDEKVEVEELLGVEPDEYVEEVGVEEVEVSKE